MNKTNVSHSATPSGQFMHYAIFFCFLFYYRSILCTTPPIPKRAEMVFSERPNINKYEYKTEIHYKCQEHYHFDYPVPDDFISFYYTENINEIDVRCTEDKNWEVRGGIEG